MEAAVLDRVVDGDGGPADRGLDPAGQDQELAEHGGLADLALGPECAGVPVPALAVAPERGRRVGDSAMQAVADPLAVGIAVVLRTLLGRAHDVVEAAGVHEAAEGAEPAQPVLGVGLVQPGAAEARGRAPAQGHAHELHRAHVHGPVDHDLGHEPAAGADAQDPQPSRRPIGVLDEVDPEQLRAVADMPCQLGTGQRMAEDHGHSSCLPKSCKPRHTREGGRAL